MVERITVIKLAVDDRGSNSRPLTNRGKGEYSEVDKMTVTGIGESCNLVREGKMFVKDKAKISKQSGRCQVKSCVFWQVGF